MTSRCPRPPLLILRPAGNTAVIVAPPAAGTLYAQPIANGVPAGRYYTKDDLTQCSKARWQIILLRIMDPPMDRFQKEMTVGFFEYYKDGKLLAEKLLIKFDIHTSSV